MNRIDKSEESPAYLKCHHHETKKGLKSKEYFHVVFLWYIVSCTPLLRIFLSPFWPKIPFSVHIKFGPTPFIWNLFLGVNNIYLTSHNLKHHLNLHPFSLAFAKRSMDLSECSHPQSYVQHEKWSNLFWLKQKKKKKNPFCVRIGFGVNIFKI